MQTLKIKTSLIANARAKSGLLITLTMDPYDLDQIMDGANKQHYASVAKFLERHLRTHKFERTGETTAEIKPAKGVVNFYALYTLKLSIKLARLDLEKLLDLLYQPEVYEQLRSIPLGLELSTFTQGDRHDSLMPKEKEVEEQIITDLIIGLLEWHISNLPQPKLLDLSPYQKLVDDVELVLRSFEYGSFSTQFITNEQIFDRMRECEQIMGWGKRVVEDGRDTLQSQKITLKEFKAFEAKIPEHINCFKEGEIDLHSLVRRLSSSLKDIEGKLTIINGSLDHFLSEYGEDRANYAKRLKRITPPAVKG